MRFIPTEISDVILVEPQIFGDDRGFFMETYQTCKFTHGGISHPFVQDNHSGSKQGVLRGLHYQIQQQQGKLVRVIKGEIYDVAVDLRINKPTFGKWISFYLSEQNKQQLWIPPGFGHGFYTLSEWAEVVYRTTDFYAPEWERTIRWDDPTLNIAWPLLNTKHPFISPKDAQGKQFVDSDLFNTKDL